MTALGLPGPPPPGRPGSARRAHLAERLAVLAVRRVAAAAGAARVGIVRRRGRRPGEVLLVWPWLRAVDAELLAEEVAGLLDGLADGLDAGDVPGAVAAAGARLRGAPVPPPPAPPVPTVPVVAVTGTNGKTTTTRLVAHMGRCAGRSVGWTSTDGIYVDGVLVDEGDWSGYGGAGRVLAEPGIGLAVLETARGGVLRRGIGAAHNDVAVVTNVAADHLGLGGIDTLDQLAEVKAAIVRITRPDGWVVLNAEDPRTLAMRSRSRARPFLFALDPAAPGLRLGLEEGGRAATVVDGHVAVVDPGGAVDRLVPVVDVPVTLAGASSVNLANALAAAAAGLGVGLPTEAVVEGLRTFVPDPTANPGRLNVYDLDGRTVVIDSAHNEPSTVALLEVLHAFRPAGAAVRVAIGTAGDRRDEDLVAMGEVAGRGADQVVICEKPTYLRDRDPVEMVELLREGVRRGGRPDVPDFPDELSALVALVGPSRPGDVVAVMCHEQRGTLAGWIEDHGGAFAGPELVRSKVVAARGTPG
ncbi:MAG TPA: Mur ligase family protein [Acidimicrobiales bacterium]